MIVKLVQATKIYRRLSTISSKALTNWAELAAERRAATLSAVLGYVPQNQSNSSDCNSTNNDVINFSRPSLTITAASTHATYPRSFPSKAHHGSVTAAPWTLSQSGTRRCPIFRRTQPPISQTVSMKWRWAAIIWIWFGMKSPCKTALFRKYQRRSNTARGRDLLSVHSTWKLRKFYWLLVSFFYSANISFNSFYFLEYKKYLLTEKIDGKSTINVPSDASVVASVAVKNLTLSPKILQHLPHRNCDKYQQFYLCLIDCNNHLEVSEIAKEDDNGIVGFKAQFNFTQLHSGFRLNVAIYSLKISNNLAKVTYI